MDWGRRERRLGIAMLVTGLLGAGGLSACTGDEPKPGLSPSPSATATSVAPTPTATPPMAPTAEATAKSAEAFVKYFWEVHNYAYATLDTELFESISGPECTFCSSTINDLQSIKLAGSTAEGSAVRLFVAAVPPGKIDRRILVATVISQAPGREIHKDGSVRDFPGMAKSPSTVALSWMGGKWVVHDLSINKPDDKS